MSQAFLDYYKCPECFGNFDLAGKLSEDSGYFGFGRDTICYGQSCSGFRAKLPTDALYDASENVAIDGSAPLLPFDPTQIINNLRYERYGASDHGGEKQLSANPFSRDAYYFVRPLLPVPMRKHLQRMRLRGWEKIAFPAWPVDRTVDRMAKKLLALSLKAHSVDQIPFIWFWPYGSPSCAILTHDVEELAGRDLCSHVMDLDESAGIKSSFQIVPEKRYPISESFLNSIRQRGFEINVHDLNHDGHLFRNRAQFLRRADLINQYGKQFGAIGFRSGALYRNLDWYDALDFSYDMSVPNVASLDPQRGGCCTVMPFFIGNIVELPLTTIQDYSLFHVLNDYSIDVWKQQIALIMREHGLVSFIIHPDYVVEKPARETYKALLDYLVELRSQGKTWIAPPGEVNRWWRERSQMKLVHKGGTWRMEGSHKERARIAYARLLDDQVVYCIGEAS